MLADGDGEADLRLATDGGHGVGVEAAVGPHRELSLGPGMAHPSHGLPQEVGGAPSGIGPAFPRELSGPLDPRRPNRTARNVVAIRMTTVKQRPRHSRTIAK